MIEWGCKYQLKKNSVTGRQGDWSYAPCENRAEAEQDVRHFLEANDGATWEAGLVWHTAAVLPGEWQDYQPGGPAAEGSDDWLAPLVLSDLLALASVAVPPEVVAIWTMDERQMAGEWAAAEHLHASDNPVPRLPKPGFLARTEEICGSPAQAQLAVEAWQARTGESTWMMNPSAVARMAREAITGLIVLLKDGQPAGR